MDHPGSSGIQPFKIGILATARTDFHPFHLRLFRACSGPFDHGAYRFRRSLNHCFHGAIAAISDPASGAELLSLDAHGLAEEYALNMTANSQMVADIHWFLINKCR